MDKAIKRSVTMFLLALMVVIGGFKFFEKIENGYVGVRYSMNGGVKDETLGQGVKFVGLDRVTQYPVRLQTVKAKKLNLATEDGKATHVSITYAYKVDPTKVSGVFREFGSVKVEDIEAGWLKAQLLKSARNVVAQYSLLDVTGGKSTEVQQKILEQFEESVKGKGFLVEDVAFGVPDVDAETQKSIDEIIKAGQEREKAVTEAETAKINADSKAYQKTKAAEAEAESNRKIGESITENLIKYKEAEGIAKYGNLKTIMGDGQAIVDGK